MPRWNWQRKPARGIEAVCGGVSIVFCMIASLAVMMLSKDLAEDVLGRAAGPALLALLITGWLGGGVVLAGVLVRQWDAGRRRRVVLALVLLAVAVPALLCSMPVFAGDWGRFDTVFGPHAAEYMARTPDGTPAPNPVIRGRCVLVSDGGGQVSVGPMNDLPRRLRAEAVGEVRSVVQLRWAKEELADPQPLSDGTPVPAERPWVRTCRVRVLDAATNQPLAEKTFRGEWRYAKYKNGPKWTGELASHLVTDFLRELPQEK